MTSTGLLEGGVYLLDKGPGLSSRQAASQVARAWSIGKFGHGGTLDPEATGVLLVLLGRATRLSRFITGQGKRYSFAAVLGAETDSDDATGKVLKRSSRKPGLTEPSVLEEVLAGFTGSFMQTPPSFSAKRIDGTRAFEAARKGESLELPQKRVSATGWVVEDIAEDRLRLEVTVSSGTYVRALARDIGRALGSCAHADEIRRVSVGDFSIEECSPDPDSPRAMLSMAGAMRGFPTVTVSGRSMVSVRHGTTVPARARGTVAVLDPEGSLLAVGEADGTAVHPICVLRPL